MNPARQTKFTRASSSAATSMRSYTSRSEALGGKHADRNPPLLRARNSRCAFAIADDDRDFGAGNSPRRDAVGQRLKIRAAPRQ